MPQLDGIALFIHIVLKGSITHAATHLSMPKSTLSRQLNDLEEKMGVKLLQRNTRNLHLTEAGQALFSQARDLIEELNDIQKSIGAYQRTPKGQLTLLWPQELFTEQMGNVISEFLLQWPNIDLHGAQYTGNLPQVNYQYDLQFVLHQHSLPASDWIARTLLSIPQELYIASKHVNSAPKTLPELSNFPCITQDNEREWLFREHTTQRAIAISGRLTLNSTDMRLQAALSGLGIVRLPSYLANKYVTNGQLSILSFPEKPIADTLSVLYHSRQLPLKTKLFLEHFQNQIGRLHSQM